MNEHLHADGSGRLRHLLSVQCELNALSDRQGLAVLALTGAAIRFQAYLLGWAVYFGAIEHVPGEGDVVVIPTPGRRHHIAQAISVSAVTLNKLFVTLMSPNAPANSSASGHPFFRRPTIGCATATAISTSSGRSASKSFCGAPRAATTNDAQPMRGGRHPAGCLVCRFCLVKLRGRGNDSQAKEPQCRRVSPVESRPNGGIQLASARPLHRGRAGLEGSGGSALVFDVSRSRYSERSLLKYPCLLRALPVIESMAIFQTKMPGRPRL